MILMETYPTLHDDSSMGGDFDLLPDIGDQGWTTIDLTSLPGLPTAFEPDPWFETDITSYDEAIGPVTTGFDWTAIANNPAIQQAVSGGINALTNRARETVSPGLPKLPAINPATGRTYTDAELRRALPVTQQASISQSNMLLIGGIALLGIFLLSGKK